MSFANLMGQAKEEIKKGVNSFDPWKTGFVSTSDLGRILRWLKLIPTNAEIAELASKLDPLESGKVSIPTVYEAVARIWPSSPTELQARAWGAFLTFDKLDSGTMTPENLREILLRIGREPLPEREVEMIIRENTDPKSGLIEYRRLIRQWLK
ncbi:calmodulin-2 [Clonorchis sinensis]|uniref:Calmodulin-2 n=1 Tax=Clonorchis sinensis TaxID=79923 RepID=H2KV33_CLOSI|nr:calmodulin-2 [Clonorchis sinensis]